MNGLKVVHMDGIWFVERRGIRWSLRDVLGVAEWERFPVGVSTRLDEAFESAHSCPSCAAKDDRIRQLEEECRKWQRAAHDLMQAVGITAEDARHELERRAKEGKDE